MMIGVKETKDGLTSNCAADPLGSVHYDPASQRVWIFPMPRSWALSSGWTWMKRAEYPEAVDVLTGYMAAARDSDSHLRRQAEEWPVGGLQAQARSAVRALHNDGGWKFYIYQAGFVIEPMDSPYLGEEDRPECPIKAVSLYIDRDNNRYGEVRAMIDPQDEVNKRRSKAVAPDHASAVWRFWRRAWTRLRSARVGEPDGVFVGDVSDVNSADR